MAFYGPEPYGQEDHHEPGARSGQLPVSESGASSGFMVVTEDPPNRYFGMAWILVDNVAGEVWLRVQLASDGGFGGSEPTAAGVYRIQLALSP